MSASIRSTTRSGRLLSVTREDPKGAAGGRGGPPGCFAGVVAARNGAFPRPAFVRDSASRAQPGRFREASRDIENAVDEDDGETKNRDRVPNAEAIIGGIDHRHHDAENG